MPFGIDPHKIYYQVPSLFIPSMIKQLLEILSSSFYIHPGSTCKGYDVDQSGSTFDDLDDIIFTRIIS